MPYPRVCPVFTFRLFELFIDSKGENVGQEWGLHGIAKLNIFIPDNYNNFRIITLLDMSVVLFFLNPDSTFEENLSLLLIFSQRSKCISQLWRHYIGKIYCCPKHLKKKSQMHQLPEGILWDGNFFRLCEVAKKQATKTKFPKKKWSLNN